MSFQLPKDLEKRLDALVQKTHQSKDYYLREALEEYLQEQEDLLIALERLDDIESGKVKPVSLEDAKKFLFDDALHP